MVFVLMNDPECSNINSVLEMISKEKSTPCTVKCAINLFPFSRVNLYTLTKISGHPDRYCTYKNTGNPEVLMGDISTRSNVSLCLSLSLYNSAILSHLAANTKRAYAQQRHYCLVVAANGRDAVARLARMSLSSPTGPVREDGVVKASTVGTTGSGARVYA